MSKKQKSMTEQSAIANEFEIDSELLGEEFNAPRTPRLPYGIVVNDNPAGIFIPLKNLEKAGWLGTGSNPAPLDPVTSKPIIDFIGPDEAIDVDLSGGKERGLFLDKARILVLGSTRPYIRYKNSDELGDSALSLIGWYDELKYQLDKKTMDVVSENLLVFLNGHNQPMHQRPLKIRFKNVALWSLKEALDEFYSQAELCFAKITGTRASGKSDRWRALCVFDVQFKAHKEGEGANKSWCCKVDSYVKPTRDNFPNLFLGSQKQKALVWEMIDMNSGFTNAQLAGISQSTVLLGPSKSALPSADELPY